MTLYEKKGSSEDIMKIDMEYEQMTSRKDRLCRRQTGILVLLGSVCTTIFMVMIFVVYLHQQSKFSVLESWMKSHDFNTTSIKADFQVTGSQQDLSHNEMKKMMNDLSSAVSALTSRLNEAVEIQDKKHTEAKQILDSLQSSVTLLQSDQQRKERGFESLSSSVSALTSTFASLSSQLSTTMQEESQIDVKNLMVQLNDAVKKQDQKQSETERVLESLKSSVQSDQQNKQRQLESMSSSLADLKGSMSNLISSVASISSKQQSTGSQQDLAHNEMKKMMNDLSTAVSALTSRLNQAESLSSSLRDLKSSVSNLILSVASISSKQQSTEERIMKALKEMTANTSAKTPDIPVACKSGWISYKSSCFLFSSNQLNWSEARDSCKEQGALLLKIQDDDDEWAFLNRQTIPTHYWVGLTDQDTGLWRWADETPYTMNQERWNPGQPDDWKEHGLGEEGEDCGQITYTGKLNDRHCSAKLQFICRV